MTMFKYILKRIALVFVVTLIITTICFTLIKLLEPESPQMGHQIAYEKARREALGYNKPIMEQFGIYLKNIFTKWDWGTSWKKEYLVDVRAVIGHRLPPTVLLNLYSLIFALPFGILLGIWAAIKKNKPTDHVISTSVMIFISVPAYVYAFVLQYVLGFKFGWFPIVISSLHDAGGTWFSATMFRSMVLPVLSLSFGTIASLARFTRAELTEALTSEYMLLARAKGLSRSKAIKRHAMRNAMVPILPIILSMFFSLVSGAIITERIFQIPGIGNLYLDSIFLLDYDLFIGTSIFYSVIGLASTLVIDLSYGIMDPRIRMGER